MNNSELLFLYDARLSNPNGDPDDENRPRMDYQDRRNLVSDVRLKRYIRDYLHDRGMQIFVDKTEGRTVTADRRLQDILQKKKADVSDLPILLDTLIDVRLFGATMTIQGVEGERGGSIQIIGPVQFTWGYSLNHADVVDSYSITSHFGSREKNEQGTIGKDYRIFYSLLGFAGVLSGLRAEHTRLKEEDVHLLDEALITAIPLQATRSKIGQYPRLYLRFEYKDPWTTLGDWRETLKLSKEDDLRSISDVDLDISALDRRIAHHCERIARIWYWQDENLVLRNGEKAGQLQEILSPNNVELLTPVLPVLQGR